MFLKHTFELEQQFNGSSCMLTIFIITICIIDCNQVFETQDKAVWVESGCFFLRQGFTWQRTREKQKTKGKYQLWAHFLDVCRNFWLIMVSYFHTLILKRVKYGRSQSANRIIKNKSPIYNESNSASKGFGHVPWNLACQDYFNDTPRGYCWNYLDAPYFMTRPKPLLTEFGIVSRLESSAKFLTFQRNA